MPIDRVVRNGNAIATEEEGEYQWTIRSTVASPVLVREQSDEP